MSCFRRPLVRKDFSAAQRGGDGVPRGQIWKEGLRGHGAFPYLHVCVTGAGWHKMALRRLIKIRSTLQSTSHLHM